MHSIRTLVQRRGVPTFCLSTQDGVCKYCDQPLREMGDAWWETEADSGPYCSQECENKDAACRDDLWDEIYEVVATHQMGG